MDRVAGMGNAPIYIGHEPIVVLLQRNLRHYFKRKANDDTTRTVAPPSAKARKESKVMKNSSKISMLSNF